MIRGIARQGKRAKQNYESYFARVASYFAAGAASKDESRVNGNEYSQTRSQTRRTPHQGIARSNSPTVLDSSEIWVALRAFPMM